jgi:hypothetical protein
MHSQIYNTVIKLLVEKKITPDKLEDTISKMHSTYCIYYPDEHLDKEQLLREILYDYGVFEGNAKILEDNRDHEEWLANERASIRWNFWNRYKKYLEEDVDDKLPPSVVKSIEESTDEILKRLESPLRNGSWDRRGMVVGNVQSGKTSNYIGLIAKAVDAQYKIVIVLAGLNNDLRSQTQKRIDKGFIGRDTKKKTSYNQTSSRIGAGLLPGFYEPPVISLTSADANGDFKKNVHNTVTITPGGDPIIAVIKKNVTPLENLFNWFNAANNSGKISNVPLLLIDDEADNASIDTNAAKRISGADSHTDAAEQDPTRINRLIRKILNCFSQSAYVGYTATPFANIFIYPTDTNTESKFGEDLYPRSFIVNLHAPSNYIGPEKIFGLYKDRTANIDETQPLPLTRRADDYSTVFPDKHKIDLQVTNLPDSLYRAIYSFILSAAARNVRGQGLKHHSMLVHVTRFVNVQNQITGLLKEAVKKIVNQLDFQTGPKYEELIKDMATIWREDFEPTTKSVMSSLNDNGITTISWPEIKERLYASASKIEVKSVNGDAENGGLMYEAYPSGSTVIAVGGDKLSRGLTLEGLTVSYYARTSKMYDTLLQMGRWFGYRNGYADLCRLYTSKQLIEWYKHIAVANTELRRELDDMADLGATPENYGLKVRTHPDGMIITALNKMRNSEKRTVTYSGKLVQITRYYKANICNQTNIDFVDTWLRQLGIPKYPTTATRNNFLWENISPDQIVDFLQNITIHPSCFNASPKIVSQYILNQVEDNELTSWSVALVSILSGEKYLIANHEIGLSWRSDQQTQDTNSDTIYLIRNNLITESDQDVDLNAEEKAKALTNTQLHWKPNGKSSTLPTEPSPVWIRKCRKKENGLLLIYLFKSGTIENNVRSAYNNVYLGYALSFPDSETASPVEYKIDEVYVRNNFDEE